MNSEGDFFRAKTKFHIIIIFFNNCISCKGSYKDPEVAHCMQKSMIKIEQYMTEIWHGIHVLLYATYETKCSQMSTSSKYTYISLPKTNGCNPIPNKLDFFVVVLYIFIKLDNQIYVV